MGTHAQQCAHQRSWPRMSCGSSACQPVPSAKQQVNTPCTAVHSPAELAQDELRQRRLLALSVAKLGQALQQQARNVSLTTGRVRSIEPTERPAAGTACPPTDSHRGLPASRRLCSPASAQPPTCSGATLSSTRTKLSPVTGPCCKAGEAGTELLVGLKARYDRNATAPPACSLQHAGSGAHCIPPILLLCRPQQPSPAGPNMATHIATHPRHGHGPERCVQGSRLGQLLLQALQEAAPQLAVERQLLLQQPAAARVAERESK